MSDECTKTPPARRKLAREDHLALQLAESRARLATSQRELAEERLRLARAAEESAQRTSARAAREIMERAGMPSGARVRVDEEGVIWEIGP